MQKYKFVPCRECGMVFAKKIGREYNNHKLCGSCKDVSAKRYYQERLKSIRRTRNDYRIIDMLQTLGKVFIKQRIEREKTR